MSGLLVGTLLGMIISACSTCYFALQWKQAERRNADQQRIIAQLLGGTTTEADNPPPRTIRIARDGAAGLALVAIATATWIAHAPGKLAIAGLILAASTALLLMVTQPAHTPPIHRRPGQHRIVKPTPSGQASTPPPVAPSALAAAASSTAGSVGNVASTGPLAPTPTTTPIEPVTVTSSPTTPTTTAASPTGTCTIKLDLGQFVEICIN